MKKLFILLTCLVSLLSAAQPVFNENRFALIIGLSEYENKNIQILKGVPYDMDSAKKIALAMGIPEKNIEIIRNSNATKNIIISKLEKMGANSVDGSRNFVYFSGHGTRYFDSSAGGCVEGRLSYDGQAITNKEFANATRKLISSSDKLITFIDACHSEGVAPSKISVDRYLQNLLRSFILKKELAELIRAPFHQTKEPVV